MRDVLTPCHKFFCGPLEFVVIMSEDSVSALSGVEITLARGRGRIGGRKARIECIGRRCDEEEPGVIYSEEGRRECGKDSRGKVFDPTNDGFSGTPSAS